MIIEHMKYENGQRVYQDYNGIKEGETDEQREQEEGARAKTNCVQKSILWHILHDI